MATPAGRNSSKPHRKASNASNAEMLAIARTIIERGTEKFDSSNFGDRYQEALRELIEAKMRGLPIKPRAVETWPQSLI